MLIIYPKPQEPWEGLTHLDLYPTTGHQANSEEVTCMGSGSALWHLEQIKQWMDNGILNYSDFPGDL
jgi:hypothetical protein